MAVNYKAPVKDILFAFDVLNSYEKLNNIDRFKDFNLDIAVPAIEECSKFAEEVLAPINADGDKHGAKYNNGVGTSPISITFFPFFKNESISAFEISELEFLPSLPMTIVSLSFGYKFDIDLAIKPIASRVNSLPYIPRIS